MSSFFNQVALGSTNKNNILKVNAFISLNEYIYNKILNMIQILNIQQILVNF